MDNKTKKKIRTQIKEVYDGFDTVEEIIFTTYNFEALVFEKYIVTSLMGIEAINTKGSLNEANEWLRVHKVAIFYDKGALSEMETHLTLNTYPVYIPSGVFHPKIILMVGTKHKRLCAHLFVSSANLTCSGYGRNIESVADIEVTTKNVVKELRSFLRGLFEVAGLTIEEFESNYPITNKFLRQRGFEEDESTHFFYNLGKGKKRLYDVISQWTGDMCIYSPYFCKDFEKMIEGLKYKTLNVIPAKDGEHYNIEKEVYKRCIVNNITFKQLAEDRFPHMKMISAGSNFVIGSHNFTKSALEDLNAEASLIFNLPKNKRPKVELVEVNESLFIKKKEELNNPDETQIRRCPEEVQLTVDWAKQIVYIAFKNITMPCLVRLGKFKICDLNNRQETPKVVSFNKIIASDIRFEEEVLQNKVFKVYRREKSKEELIITGLINEINWKECRPELRCNTLDEALQEWRYEINPEEMKRRSYEIPLPPIEEDENEEKEYNECNLTEREQKDVFDNYFELFKVLSNLRQAIGETEKDLYDVFKKKPGSIGSMLELIKKDKIDKKDEQDTLREWIIVNELINAVDRIKKIYEEIKKEERKIEAFSKEINKVSRELKKMLKETETTIRKSDKVWNEQYFNWIKKELGYKG